MLVKVVFVAFRVEVVLTSVYNKIHLFNRIISTRIERVTTEHSTYCHAASAQSSVPGDRVNGIFRTRGNESARRG